jgi:8-oxo-dGTP pyrophosphatase MutT (NUDIX family)
MNMSVSVLSDKLPNSLTESIRLARQTVPLLTKTTDAYRELAPRYSYGRHRGPHPRYAHRAAVMIGLIPNEEEEWFIPLTLRPPQMIDHAGQVSLPGGRSEATESAWHTASRELTEELGCSTTSLRSVAEFPSVYVFASRHQVTPVFGVFDSPVTFSPNPAEVAELILLPLTFLLSESAVSIGVLQRGTVQYEAPGFRVGSHFVWGATAMILGEFRRFCLTNPSIDSPIANWQPDA